jgi:polyphosphate kinase
MKRVGSLKQQILAGVTDTSIDGRTAQNQVDEIKKRAVKMNQEMSTLLIDEILPSLEEAQIHLLKWKKLSVSEKRWAEDFFNSRVFPVLTPMAVDIGHPFPVISNLTISLAVALTPPGSDDLQFARIKIPDIFPSWIKIPESVAKEGSSTRFVSMVEVVKSQIKKLFPNMEIKEVMTFRVTRSIETDSDKEGAEDLLEMIEEEIRQRRYAPMVRLEHGPKPDPWLLSFLMEEMGLGEEDIYPFPISLEFKDLSEVSKLKMPEHRFAPWSPVVPMAFQDEDSSLFHQIRNGDLVVHHPYESFAASVEKFVDDAALDPDVVAIKMTLYRTGENSAIVRSLIKAAERGKQVVCLVELTARMDEERNIQWAQQMENAGVHVVYGIVGLKIHAKLTLVVRREKDEFRSYCHIGTGNYHSITGKLYTDFGLFTAKPEITSEVVEVFHFLTGRSLKTDYKQLLVSPINLKSSFLQLIANEISNAINKKPCGIFAKFNSLQDKDIIDALYSASQAGVPIELVVRGFSCLIPGKKGLSENIKVTSVLGRFLEHSRVFWFRAGQKNEIDGKFFIGSADWMSRNLLRRVEVVTPIEDKAGKEKIWEALMIHKNDQRLTWDMGADGEYKQRKPKISDDQNGSQEQLMLITQQRNEIFQPRPKNNPNTLR